MCYFHRFISYEDKVGISVQISGSDESTSCRGAF